MFGAGIPSGVSLDFLHSDTDSVDRSSYTFTSVPLGSPLPDRYIVVCVNTTSSLADDFVNAVTVNGVSAAQVVSAFNDSGAFVIESQIWIAAVPSGSSGSVVLSATSTLRDASIGVFEIHGLQSTTPIDTDTEKVSSGTASLSLSAPSGESFIIATFISENSGPFTWGGVVVEDFEDTITGSGYVQGGASSIVDTSGAKSVTLSTVISSDYQLVGVCLQ